jgi:hypothetical protein
MLFTSPRITRGWFTEGPLWRGRDGIRIPESGLAARIYRGAGASESGGLAVLDGAGVIGDSIGITTMQCLTTAGTTRVAERFTTGAIFIEEQAGAGDSTALAAELALDPMQGTGLAGTSAGAAESTTVPAERPGPSKETLRPLEDILHPAVKAALAQAPSAATTKVDRQGAIRPEEARASVVQRRGAGVERRAGAAAEQRAAAVAGIGNRILIGVRALFGARLDMFLVERDI